MSATLADAVDTDLRAEARRLILKCSDLAWFGDDDDDPFYLLAPLEPGGLTEVLFLGRLKGKAEQSGPLTAWLTDEPPGFARAIAIEHGW